MCIYIFYYHRFIKILEKNYNNIIRENFKSLKYQCANVYIETTIKKKTRQLICRCFVQNTEKINFYKTECVFVFLYRERIKIYFIFLCISLVPFVWFVCIPHYSGQTHPYKYKIYV